MSTQLAPYERPPISALKTCVQCLKDVPLRTYGYAHRELDKRNKRCPDCVWLSRAPSRAKNAAEGVTDAVKRTRRTDKIRDALKEQPRTFDELITETRFNEDDLCDVLLRLLNKQEIEVWNVEINNLDFTRWYRLVQ